MEYPMRHAMSIFLVYACMCVYRKNTFKWLVGYAMLYDNQKNARTLIGQSAVGYCTGKPMEKSRVFWIII